MGNFDSFGSHLANAFSAICGLKKSRFTPSKPSIFSIASDEKFIHHLTTSFHQNSLKKPPLPHFCRGAENFPRCHPDLSLILRITARPAAPYFSPKAFRRVMLRSHVPADVPAASHLPQLSLRIHPRYSFHHCRGYYSVIWAWLSRANFSYAADTKCSRIRNRPADFWQTA